MDNWIGLAVVLAVWTCCKCGFPSARGADVSEPTAALVGAQEERWRSP